MENKFLYIPGWLDKGGFNGYENELSIWSGKMNLDGIKENVVVGHSAGALAALAAWQKNPDLSLILIGPLVPKRNPIVWIFKWLAFIFTEGTPMPMRRIKLLVYLIPATIKLAILMRLDPMRIIKEIPKDKLLIIRGCDDVYFCDKVAIDDLKKEGVNVIEVEGMGHCWSEKINGIIDQYLADKS